MNPLFSNGYMPQSSSYEQCPNTLEEPLAQNTRNLGHSSWTLLTPSPLTTSIRKSSSRIDRYESFRSADSGICGTDSDQGPLEKLQKAIVESEKQEQEGNNEFRGNLYFFFALREISTPDRAIEYYQRVEDEARSQFTSNDSAILRKVVGKSNTSLLKYCMNSLRFITPFIQIIAPIIIILTQWETMIELKEDWVKRCGHVQPFCQYMKKYRLNFLFDPVLHNSDSCSLGEVSVYTMNKFFNFNPYDDVTFYMYLTRFISYTFLLAVGMRVSMDVAKDHRNRLKALLIAKRYFGEMGKRRNYPTNHCMRAHFWIHAGGIIRAFSAILTLLAMPLILWLSNDPKEVVLDSLGLVFIYTLDAVGSEFGLTSSRDWDDGWMGILYTSVAEPLMKVEIAKLKVLVTEKCQMNTSISKEELEVNSFWSFCEDVLPQPGTSGDGSSPEDEAEDDATGLQNLTRKRDHCLLGSIGIKTVPRPSATSNTTETIKTLSDVLYRNEAETRILNENVGKWMQLVNKIVTNCYVLLVVVLIVLYTTIAPPWFAPVGTGIVIEGKTEYKCYQNQGVMYTSAGKTLTLQGHGSTLGRGISNLT